MSMTGRIPAGRESDSRRLDPRVPGAVLAAVAYVLLVYAAALLTSGELRNSIIGKEALLETLGAVWFLAAAVTCFLWMLHLRRGRKNAWFCLFLGMTFFVAFGEETSWGQNWFRFSTPEAFWEINKQEELNLHNLAALDRREESGERKHGLAFFRTSNRLFGYFVGTLFIVIPVLARWPGSSRLLIRLGIPKVPLGFAVPLVMNYGMSFTLVGDSSELQESVIGFMCLMLCLCLYLRERGFNNQVSSISIGAAYFVPSVLLFSIPNAIVLRNLNELPYDTRLVTIYLIIFAIVGIAFIPLTVLATRPGRESPKNLDAQTTGTPSAITSSALLKTSANSGSLLAFIIMSTFPTEIRSTLFSTTACLTLSTACSRDTASNEHPRMSIRFASCRFGELVFNGHCAQENKSSCSRFN